MTYENAEEKSDYTAYETGGRQDGGAAEEFMFYRHKRNLCNLNFLQHMSVCGLTEPVGNDILQKEFLVKK